jgi:hypothetical protein
MSNGRAERGTVGCDPGTDAADAASLYRSVPCTARDLPFPRLSASYPVRALPLLPSGSTSCPSTPRT